jgi:hypothetical protein
VAAARAAGGGAAPLLLLLHDPSAHARRGRPSPPRNLPLPTQPSIPAPPPTPQLVRSLTICRVLVVPRAAYTAIASEFVTSARAVLENLQRMAETLVQQEFRGE